MSVFSSFAQFLPSAIQNTIAQHQPPPPIAEEVPPPQSRFDPSTDDEGDEEELIQQQSQQMEEQQDDRRKIKSKKERDVTKMATETFIFVRPPPSKSNHPLNLQVQLVPPNARPPSGVAVPSGSEPTTPTSASSMSTDGGSGPSLSRTASASSDYSSNTNYASNSTTSFQSMASGESNASSATSSTSSRGARRIIPLYNLQAHNVMTNVIADAGTDAKIARFQRKGLELIDLAVLEPVEVWGVRSRTGEREAKKQGLQISVDEMGSVVHSGIPLMTNGSTRPGTAGNKSLSSFLQPKNQREGSRPNTPSASSSAISLNSNSTHFSSIPQSVAPSTPQHQQFPHPPASAPPHSGTFPSTPTRPHNPPSKPIDVRGAPPSPAPPPITVSTTPTKKSSSPSLFGKFKFNKRSSTLNPFAPPPPSEDDYTTFQPPNPDRPNEYTDFGMAPLAPGDLNAKRLAIESHNQAQGKQQHSTPSLSPPNSPSSLYSNTPTPTPTTPYHPHRQSQQDDSDDIASPTPTIAPSRPGFMSAALNSLSGSNNSNNNSPPPLPPASSPGHGRNLSLTNALSRGKNRFMGGIKTGGGSSTEREPPSPSSSSSPSQTQPPPPLSSTQSQTQTGNPMAGAKGLFNKIAAGITGDKAGGSSGTDRGGLGGRNSSNGLGMSRESVDSTTSAGSGAGAKGPFGRLLQHQSSQQYIGKGGSSRNSTNLAPPGTAASSATSSPRTSFQQTSGAPPASLAGHGLMSLSQVPAQGAAAAGVVMAPPQVVVAGGGGQQQQLLDPQQQLQHQQKMTLRQLQLRPPVLGIQPTYVSASQTYAAATTVPNTAPPTQQQYASALSLPSGSDEGGAGSSTNVSFSSNGAPLQKVESHSTFNETDESGSGEAGSINRRRQSIRSKKRDGSTRRESLIFDKESSVGGSSTALASLAPSTAAGQPGTGKEKERALMYVWLVARWLKKRNPGPPARNLHGQSASEASGGAGRARDLFQNILSGRDKDRILGSSDRESKRGSWHAGAGIGLIPSLGALGNLNSPQTPSSSSGQPLVLGPVVGGGCEVRFEWKRAKMKSSKGKNKGDKKENGADDSKRGRMKSKAKPEVKVRDMVKEEGGGAPDDVDSTPRVPQVDSSPRKMSVAERKRLNRSSMASVNSFAEEKEGDSPSRNSTSPSRRSTTSTRKKRLSILRKKKEDDDEGYGGGGDDDEDEESDAEDSETPWICTLKIRRSEFVKPPGASAVDTITSSPSNGEKEQILRLKVGTLSPTPHHPKVVAMLKIPFPLPDVEVERMEIVKKKTLFNQNSEQEEKEPYYGLMLAAEDIKDIVCSTGLWLVVREGFGGVGKVNRKGDGWKIRG